MLGDNLDEEFIPEEEAEGSPGAIKKLRERLEKALSEKQEYLEGWQRSRADFANLKRDEELRREHTAARLKASLAEDLIPVLDSFEMAQAHKENNELTVLHKQLLDALRRMGIEQYGKEGEEFNPHRHEALQEEAGTEDTDHTVAAVLRSGYALGDHVIRPAQVKVYINKK